MTPEELAARLTAIEQKLGMVEIKVETIEETVEEKIEDIKETVEEKIEDIEENTEKQIDDASEAVSSAVVDAQILTNAVVEEKMEAILNVLEENQIEETAAESGVAAETGEKLQAEEFEAIQPEPPKLKKKKLYII